MAYFIFVKNLDNVENTIYRIAENQSDLNNLNINQNNYKIISDTQENFNAVKLQNKFVQKYNNDIITYINIDISYFNKNNLFQYILNFSKQIKEFLNNNSNHPLFNHWNDYYNQLNNLNLDSITYPLNKSLEQYFNDSGQLSLNPLQLP